MRKPILLVASVAAVALVAGVFYTARTALSHSFARIEADEARQSVERVRQALQADLRQLDVAAEDYALWDDFYDYVKGGADPVLLDHYFSRRGLDNIHVNVVWVVDDAGRTVVQLSTDAPPGDTRPISPQTLQSLQGYTSLIRTPADRKPRSAQLLRMPGGAMAVSVRPVSRELQPSVSTGTLVFGRYIDTSLIERLRQTSQYPVRATLLDQQGKPILSAPAAVDAWLARLDHGSDILVQTGDSTTLASHELVRDAAGRPLMVLSTTVSREALQIA